MFFSDKSIFESDRTSNDTEHEQKKDESIIHRSPSILTRDEDDDQKQNIIHSQIEKAEQTKEAMKRNIHLAVQRSDGLSNLNVKADVLRNDASLFKKKAVAVQTKKRKEYYWTVCWYYFGVCIGVLVLILFLFLVVFKVFF